ncbi:MAG: 1,4-alpha-glucan branching protein GlgB [Chitinophagaceae bacterium]|nr:MAG: 1,4-alpha-glucan branching protein GlgB [Chitinophagaceae bacterium]
MTNPLQKVQKEFESKNFINTGLPVWNYSLLDEKDVASYQDGTHYRIYEKFGAHSIQVKGVWGIYFCVWAPNAKFVFVRGNFNDWNIISHPLHARWDNSGIWEGFIPNLGLGEVYKYHIVGNNHLITDKADPVGFYSELRPHTASITWDMYYDWNDKNWMKNRAKHNALNAPWSVYEVHLPSWQRPDKNDEERYNTYDDLCHSLVPYVQKMGFTHVELMPVTEYPFDGSWGYQCTGYFAATSRFGNPQGLMKLIDCFHQAGIGVILDWVPSHFPADAHGLFMFDGSHTYEYADMRKGFHPDWNSYIFNYARNEVKSFLISSAHFWFDIFHIDGIRVDAVSSILRLDYSREEGQWEPNIHGGNGNLEAIQFIKDLNESIYRDFPDVQTIAEESTDWPGVSKPLYDDGLGFGMKWMMGWMHDSLDYFEREPIHRKYHQNDFTFSMMYYHDENFMLPISHDEVVHGKSPLVFKMPGDLWQKFANLRLFFTYMWTHPGAKLLFMGSEFGQTNEWNYKSELQWDLLEHDSHSGAQNCLQSLNELLKNEPALYEMQYNTKGFEWVNLEHRDESVMVYKRKGKKEKDDVLVILNMTPEVRLDWRIPLKGKKYKIEIFNSDLKKYDGTGNVFNNDIRISSKNKKAEEYDLIINLPPLAGIILK